MGQAVHASTCKPDLVPVGCTCWHEPEPGRGAGQVEAQNLPAHTGKEVDLALARLLHALM